jgi:hypothetical protein
MNHHTVTLLQAGALALLLSGPAAAAEPMFDRAALDREILAQGQAAMAEILRQQRPRWGTHGTQALAAQLHQDDQLVDCQRDRACAAALAAGLGSAKKS